MQQANSFEVVLVDVSENPIERPKKQKKYYSGKKKKHTLKTQILADKKSKKIICIPQSKGRKHDYRVFKESKVYVHHATKI